MKFEKYFESSSSLVIGIALTVLGFILIFLNESFYVNIVNLFVNIILLIGIRNFILYFIKRRKKEELNTSFINCLFNLIFALFLTSHKSITLSILPIAIGLYFLFNFIIQVICFIIKVKNHSRGSLYKLILSFSYLIISFILIFSPLKRMKDFLIISGLYFVLLGINDIYDFIISIIPSTYKNKIKRRFRFTLPTIFECIIPYGILNEINKHFEEENEDVDYENIKKEEKVDLEILVHVSPNGFNRMGHVDICFENELISYGNYDRSSVKGMELFGDGVIFITQKEKYIPFVIEHSKKTLFIFGISLSEKQKENLRNKINNIKNNLVKWSPPTEKDKKSDAKDYASLLYKRTKACFYKFKSGEFKTYFVLGTNCCLLANKIVGKSGIDLFKMNGIITPGSYYEYLNKELLRKNSFVVSKSIYNERRIKNDKK